MTFDIRFAANPHGVTMLRSDSFKLYESGGHYVLPNLVLYSPPDRCSMVTDLHVEMVEGVSGDLHTWLQHNWLTTSPVGRPIAGAVVVAEDVVVPAVVVDASLGTPHAGDSSRGRVTVTWKLSGTDLAGTPVEGDSRSVVLDFAPPGTVKETESPRPSTIVVGHRGRPWLDAIAAVDFAAVDFGTSASTVTLYGANPGPAKLDPAQAKHLARALADILQGQPKSDPQIEVDWKEATLQIERSLATRFPDYASATLADTALMLRSDRLRPDLVDAICEELERTLASARAELGWWLSERLHHAYDTAYRIPALPTLRLYPVLFDELNDRYDKPSALVVTDPDALKTAIQGDPGATDGRVFRDLKRSFARGDDAPIDGLRNEDQSEVRIEHLVAWFYEHLARKTEDFVADGDVQRRGSLPRLVLTYPTTTTPMNRKRLEHLVQQALGVRRVDMSYDEGVAAGLYFLMRDFGGVGAQAIGIEALRADSMSLAGPQPFDGVARTAGHIEEPRAWRQVMLVLDIGAGTTDIALIGLNLRDLTSDTADGDPAVRGRYYLIEPEVLGSTGHETLGGDSLTLRVFYWIKAAIIDAMAAHGSAGEARRRLIESLPIQFRPDDNRANPCAQAVISSDGEDPAPESIIGELRGKFDTTYEPGSESPAFRYLWDEAERAKMELGKGRPHVISKTTLTDILLAIGDHGRDYGKLVEDYRTLVPEVGITLDPESFEKLARPLLIRAVELAHHLAKIRLPKLEGGRLDRVMLSGKTSQMPLVQRVVEEIMVRRAAEYLPEQDPTAGTPVKQPRIDVETVFAKQAASLGACWATGVKEYGAPDIDNDEIANGRTELAISVDNLFTALPSNFTVHTGDLPIPVFRIGTPFTELDATGTIGVRAERWIALPETYELQREIGPSQIRRWGHFKYQDHADAEGFEVDDSVWKREHGMVPTMAAQIELDQACSPKLYLCNRGRPHYVSRGNSISLGQQYVDTDGHLARLPKMIVRTGREGSGDGVREAVLCEARELDGDDGAEVFPLHIHPEDDPDTSTTAAFDVPLPPVSPLHPSYQFYIATPDGSTDLVDELLAPGPPNPRARYRVTVTRDGVLRVHRGELPYLSASTLAEVERRPGTVLAVTLDERPEPPKSNWLPFNGTH